MKISYSWLKDIYPDIPGPEKTAGILTQTGLEVESVTRTGIHPESLPGLVVGEVLEVSKHPNADKLSNTRVDIGGGIILPIVCGAKNVAAGQKVVVAKTGAKLFPSTGEPFTIKKSKIRGELSEGMICAEDEIGLGTSHDGIMVLDPTHKPGTPIAAVFPAEGDFIFEIGLTPNRSDAISHFGVARDIYAAMFREKTAGPVLKGISDPKEIKTDKKFNVKVESPEACLRYSGLLLQNVTVGESPDWMKKRLVAAGLRPINNVVDITNYVMLELGQPLHAFDADKLGGNAIVVKKPASATVFTTLDGQQRKISADDLMICDAEKPLCIAGVFGGLESGVSTATKNIFLESACFEPVHIRKTGKRLGLKTDSSFRFERGTDPEITLTALLRATKLLNEICGAEPASTLCDIYPKPPAKKIIDYKPADFENLTGLKPETSELKEILRRLDIKIISENGGVLSLEIPQYRTDVKRVVDVTEEILRIYGYNEVPLPDRFRTALSQGPKPDRELLRLKISERLAGAGFFEIFNNSLGKSGVGTEKNSGPVKILNPLSQDLEFLRTSLLPGFLQSIAFNRNRKQMNLRFFEFGKVYSVKGEQTALKNFHEEEMLGLAITGNKTEESWTGTHTPHSIYFLKNTLHQIFSSLGLPLDYKPMEAREAGSGLEVYSGSTLLGMLISVNPGLLKGEDIRGNVFFASLSWDKMLSLVPTRALAYKEISKFPEVIRDLALVIPSGLTYEAIEKTSFETEKELLRKVELFDVYEGEKIGKGKKSYAVRFTLSDPQSTLTDERVENSMQSLIKIFRETLGAEIRS
jgi:phenylalanyl-tRNA synthetase beta chain